MAKFTQALVNSRLPVHAMRGLRFRLTVGFLLFFTLLLVALGFVVRKLLLDIVTPQSAALLEEEWAASKGYLRIVNQYPVWMADRFDPEEAIIVARIQGGVYMFTDAQGNIIERSTPAKNLGIDTTEEVLRLIGVARKAPPQAVLTEIRNNPQGAPYMLRYGLIPDKDHRYFLLLIGRSLSDSIRTVDLFTTRYFWLVPVMVLLCGAFGWVIAGRGLVPVNEVAQAAQKTTGSNLRVQIPARGSGDELDHLIEAFNHMVQRLNQSFEQMRQFSTDVSHELRTPLTAIRGQLEVALFTAETPDQFRDAMVNALQDVEQLSNIVRALLLLSQAESGQLALQMGPVNLAGIVTEMVEQFQIPAEEAGLTLQLEPSEDAIIRADKTQMERLVANLLSNSLKYTPGGGTIRTGVRCEGEDTAVFWVEDNGIGIPSEKLPHIFDRFYRVRPSQSNPVQGLGLGLSFVSWIVNAHGGRIEVDSTEGKGTRFTVRLPMDASLNSAPAAVASIPDHAKL